jgi:hypothetical protein
MDASSTISTTSSCGGVSRGSIGAGGVSWGGFAMATPILLPPALSMGYAHPAASAIKLISRHSYQPGCVHSAAPPCYP